MIKHASKQFFYEKHNKTETCLKVMKAEHWKCVIIYGYLKETLTPTLTNMNISYEGKIECEV